MKKAALFIPVILLVLASCNIQKPLYSWYQYEKATYSYIKKTEETDVEKLLEVYQEIIDNQKDTREVPPPGICADYGYLLLQNNKQEQGMALLKKEVEYYPESKIFVDRILKMLEQ